MAERFLFFNSMEISPGVHDREYQAQDFAEYFGSVLSSGLLHTNEIPGMNVTVEKGTLNTVVDPGRAIIRGHLYENTTAITLTHNLPEPSLNRIDRVVLRMNRNNSVRDIKLHVIEGVPSLNPVPPPLTRNQFVHELSLAQIGVKANTSSLDAIYLKDERMYDALCGLSYSLISLPTEIFQQQFDAWFNSQKAYFEANIHSWTAEKQADFALWVAQSKTIFEDWTALHQSDYAAWSSSRKSDFESWFLSVKAILNTTADGNLLNALNDHKEAALPHKFIDATDNKKYKYGFKTNAAKDGLIFVYEEVL